MINLVFRGVCVLWIRDILVRIRIRGSVPLTDPDPAFFFTGWQDANKKQVFFKRWFCYIVEIKIFLAFCLLMEDPGGPKTYGSYGSGSTTLGIWNFYSDIALILRLFYGFFDMCVWFQDVATSACCCWHRPERSWTCGECCTHHLLSNPNSRGARLAFFVKVR